MRSCVSGEGRGRLGLETGRRVEVLAREGEGRVRARLGVLVLVGYLKRRQMNLLFPSMISH